MAFTNQQLVDIRRFCWYPVYGAVPSSFQSYRFFQAYGLLEYRLQNLQAEEQSVVINTYLAALYQLEAAIPAASSNLDTDQAAVWKHNKNELRDREALFTNWRLKLCTFLGVPKGPDYAGGGGSVALVV